MLSVRSADVPTGGCSANWRQSAGVGFSLSGAYDSQTGERWLHVIDTLDATVGMLVEELERRFPYAAALLSGVSGMQVADNGKEHMATEVAPSQGVVFTLYDGRQLQEFATGDLEPDALARAVRGWAGELHAHSDGPPVTAVRGSASGQREDFATPMRIDPARVPLAEKLAFVSELRRRAAGADSRIQQAQALLMHEMRESIYIGRGRYLAQQVTRTFVNVYVVAVVEGRAGLDFLPKGGTCGLEGLEIGEAELAHLAEVAIELTHARHIEPGEYDVISDPTVSGTIAHESFGHGTELDLFPKGRARAARYVGQRVAAAGVDMVDDPSLAGGFGSYFFDDEGELAAPTRILRDGILVLPISDLASATQTAGIRTPNGRRQDFTRKAYARMSNTFFAPGGSDPAEMIAQVARGIYLRKAESGVEDPMGWGVQVTAHYGEEIANGQLTGRRFAPIVITGYVPDLLRGITMVGRDFELGPGMCGKWTKEMVPVSTGGPHLRMRARLG